MKHFHKAVNACTECPNVAYIHFDGEGQSSEYQFDHPVCSVTDELEPAKRNIMGKYYDGRFIARRIPNKNSIPPWCPL